MMIPKIIHYCWFGRTQLSSNNIKCIESWKKYCPDYRIIEWNEDNFDLQTAPLYVRQAYDEKKWAFVTDYVRLYIIYSYGGVYFDTDVELIKNIDALLEYNAFFGFENNRYVATGLGFGAISGFELIKKLLDDYERCPFITDNGKYDMMPCPERNAHVFREYGLEENGEKQLLRDNVIVLSKEYLCPIDYTTSRKRITAHTFSIHWYDGSWVDEESKKYKQKQMWLARFVGEKNADTILGITLCMKREGIFSFFIKRLRKTQNTFRR